MKKVKGKITQLSELIDDNNVVTYSALVFFDTNLPDLRLGKCEVIQ